jgi:hypothetical protein
MYNEAIAKCPNERLPHVVIRGARVKDF